MIERVKLDRSFYLLLLTSLAACSGSSGGETTAVNTGGNSTPPPVAQRIIDNEDLTPGLKGVDANNNGIRDDIDRLIAQKYSATPELQKAAEQKARALQKSMEATTRQQALAAGDGIMRAADCAFKVFPQSTSSDIKFYDQLSKELESLTNNTQERFKAYWNAESLKGGGVFRQPDEPVCD
jgi:hypothetical protein